MDMDLAYANSAFIPGSETLPAKWSNEARAFRTQMGGSARLDVPYGPADRQRLDLFHPSTPARGLLVFLHGGYWMAFGKEDWSHLARGAILRGWAVAMPSYTLAPQAHIATMTGEVARAVSEAARLVTGPVVVTGHSAGGHLAARLACLDAKLSPDAASRLRRVVPISPLAELEPITHTKMNDILALDAAEVAAESPARLAPRPEVQVTVWVGGQERPAFLWQARTLSEAWACPWHVAAGRHHFDVVDDLVDPDSGLIGTLLDGL